MSLFVAGFPPGLFAAQNKSSVLIDFSEENVVKGSTSPKEKNDALLKFVGIKKYFTDEKQCKDDDFETPIFYGATEYEGHFIQGPGEQKLISFSVSRCNNPYWHYESHLILEVDGKFIKNIKNGCTTGAEKITAPDENSLQKIITSCGSAKQGYMEKYAKLYGFTNNQFKQIKDFGLVYWDNCGAAEKGEERVSVIFNKGKGKFLVKNYQRSCESQDKSIKDYSFMYNGKLKFD